MSKKSERKKAKRLRQALLEQTRSVNQAYWEGYFSAVIPGGVNEVNDAEISTLVGAILGSPLASYHPAFGALIDTLALKSDWEAVGDDIRTAIEEYEHSTDKVAS